MCSWNSQSLEYNIDSQDTTNAKNDCDCEVAVVVDIAGHTIALYVATQNTWKIFFSWIYSGSLEMF